MRAMRANRELELKQELVRQILGRVLRSSILTPDLAELARAVGEKQRLAGVTERCLVGTLRPVVACARKPATGELIVAGEVIAKRVLDRKRLLAAAPYELGPTQERAVDGAAKRFPSHRAVDAEETRCQPS